MLSNERFFQYSDTITYPLARAFATYLLYYSEQSFEKSYKENINDLEDCFFLYIENMKIHQKIIELIKDELYHEK